MRDLNYELKQLCHRNHDGSYATQHAREDILTQIAAVKTALEQVGARLLEDHVTHCVRDAIASGDETAADEKAAELLTAVQRFVKTR